MITKDTIYIVQGNYVRVIELNGVMAKVRLVSSQLGDPFLVRQDLLETVPAYEMRRLLEKPQ